MQHFGIGDSNSRFFAIKNKTHFTVSRHVFDISYPNPMWLYSACTVTLVAFGHYNRPCYLLTYLPHEIITKKDNNGRKMFPHAILWYRAVIFVLKLHLVGCLNGPDATVCVACARWLSMRFVMHIGSVSVCSLLNSNACFCVCLRVCVACMSLRSLAVSLLRIPPLSGDYGQSPGLGLLRLHSTFRHDLKIYASDEGRVQMTAAAFAKVRRCGRMTRWPELSVC